MRFLKQVSKSELIDLILDERISSGIVTDSMARCGYTIGEDQRNCPSFEMMEDYEDGEMFYCASCLIENGKGFCEISIKENK